MSYFIFHIYSQLLIQRRPKAGTKKRSKTGKTAKVDAAQDRRQSLVQQNEDQDSDNSSSSQTPRRKSLRVSTVRGGMLEVYGTLYPRIYFLKKNQD